MPLFLLIMFSALIKLPGEIPGNVIQFQKLRIGNDFGHFVDEFLFVIHHFSLQHKFFHNSLFCVCFRNFNFPVAIQSGNFLFFWYS